MWLIILVHSDSILMLASLRSLFQLSGTVL